MIDPAEIAELRRQVDRHPLTSIDFDRHTLLKLLDAADRCARLEALLGECATNPAIVAYKPELRERIEKELNQ